MARIKRHISVISVRNSMKPAVIEIRMRAVERDGTGALRVKPKLPRRRFSQNSHSSVSGSHMSAFLHCIRELNRSSLNVVKTRTVCSSGGLQRSNSLAERTYVFAELQPWLTARPPLLLHTPPFRLLEANSFVSPPQLCSFSLFCAFLLHPGLADFTQK